MKYVLTLVVRSRRPFFRSRPRSLLLTSTLALIGFTFVLPQIPGAHIFGFVALSWPMVATIAAITAAYVVSAEILKAWFYLWWVPHPRTGTLRYAG
jgi:Mg2+-importing ATPase